MSLLAEDPPRTDPARLELELRRCCDRLRSMSLARLSAPLAGPLGWSEPAAGAGGSRATAGFACAQRLVDLTAAGTGEEAHVLPELPDFAVGDVLAVAGNDLLAAARTSPAAARSVPNAVDLLVALRLAL